MLELVTIPIAAVEIAIEYVDPNMKLLMDRAAVVDELFRVYKEWGITVNDVEVLTEGKPSDQGIKFKLPLKRTSFFFGASQCKLVRDDANWNTASETIEILNSGWRTLVELGKVGVGTFHTDIAMHLQLRSKPAIELLKRFAPSPLFSLGESSIKTLASVVKWEKRGITIDGSAQLANGLFVRLERDFPGSVAFEEIAKQLRSDENEILDVIGVREDV